MSQTVIPSFDDSRRLTGPNLYFAETGAVLETGIGPIVDRSLIDAWQARVARVRAALGWPLGEVLIRTHRSGVTLGFSAPFDQLYAATEVNEWAWLAGLLAGGRTLPDDEIGYAPGHAAPADEDSAMHTLVALARAEASPELVSLREAANQHGLPFLVDDDELSIGAGEGSQTWLIDELPAPDAVAWSQLHSIPTALVTGSNGKTTTVRLLAAMLRAGAQHTVHSCTDGLYLDGELLEGGDYSGPGGARALLRNRQAQAAVLETARGGLLRRGLALEHADVAVVTNVQPDHFGEYGIHDLGDLVQVKLTVARAIGADGELVLNADDERLHRQGPGLGPRLAWFALDNEHPTLVAHRAAGGSTCGVREGRLRLCLDGVDHDLGAVIDMPVTLEGSARHNIANAAAASLAAAAMGVPASTIAGLLRRFGSDRADNPGRLQHWSIGGADIYIDYAHNPDGLQALLAIVTRNRGAGRLAVLLGQAGNRGDDDIRELAAITAGFNPDLVVLKEMEGYQRGRAEGDIARILRAEFARLGVAEDRLLTELDELAAARLILAWAREGDVLALPTHATEARDRVSDLLAELRDSGWQVGEPLPPLSDQA